MIKPNMRKAIRALPVEDRLELLDELSHTIAADQHELPVPAWQKAMIDECLEEIEANPGRGMSLGEFKRKLRQAIGQMKARAGKKRS